MTEQTHSEGDQVLDLSTLEKMKTFMGASSSKEDWDNRLNQMKVANGGELPKNWDPWFYTEVAGKWNDKK